MAGFWICSEEFSTLPPNCTPVIVDEYASISLNISEYPCKCLNKLLTMPRLWICMIILHIWQAFKDASGSKYLRVLNMARFYMQGLRRVLNMSEYRSIHLNNATLISLSMPENGWILLNVPEYSRNAWINCSDYARVLSMPRYSYNNIFIIVANVVILNSCLRDLYTQSLCYRFIFFYHELEHNNES